MAVNDWNRDGKKDLVDDYIEYNMYKKSKSRNNNYNSTGSGGCSNGCLTLILGVAILKFLAQLMSCL